METFGNYWNYGKQTFVHVISCSSSLAQKLWEIAPEIIISEKNIKNCVLVHKLGKILTTKCLALKAGRGKSLQALPVPTTLFLKTWRNARIPRAPLQSGISTPWINIQAAQSVFNVANLFRGKVGHQLPWRPTCETSTTQRGTDTKKRWRSVTKKRWF